MRVALVTPYSWSYRGGVNGHVEALARELRRAGDEVQVLAPYDPPGRLSRLTHGAPPGRSDPPDIPLGRTVSIPANGARSNLTISPLAVRRLHRELRAGEFDLVHVHEPLAFLIGPAVPYAPERPIVATFHAYSTNATTNLIGRGLGARLVFNRFAERIAVSEAARWTGRRWFGGEYHVIPNGVDLSLAPAAPAPAGEVPRLLFVGRPEPRKGLPLLLAAFSALAAQTPVALTVVGPQAQDVLPFLEPEVAARVHAPGRVSEAELWRHLHEADLLVAPSLSGESFGMILTEAFAAGTPVVASSIAGYSEVVQHGVDGVLVPPGDPSALALALWRLVADRDRLSAMSDQARRSAQRFAWPRVAEQVRDVYRLARAQPVPQTASERTARRLGLVPVNWRAGLPPLRLDSLDPPSAREAHRVRRTVRNVASAAALVIGVGLVLLAGYELGLRRIVTHIASSRPGWLVLAGLAMVAALLARAIAWRAVARAALPDREVRLGDLASATMVGVLVSAVLPGRLGEPTRALVAARRIGRVRHTLPVVLGSIFAQSVLNAVALLGLSAVVLATSPPLRHRAWVLALLVGVPVVLGGLLTAAPRLRRAEGDGGVARAVNTLGRVFLRVRGGLRVFADPRAFGVAAAAQLGAWAAQTLACLLVAEALGVAQHVTLAASAAVLLGVNLAAAAPLTPSNIGVFQVAVYLVLTTGYGVGASTAVAYGVVLQAVEIGTAVLLGVPALLREGLTWGDLRIQAFRAVRLVPEPEGPSPPGAELAGAPPGG